MMVPPRFVQVEKLCRPFSFAEILSATHNFDDSLLIGKGGFGQVYKGFIDDGANIVAIKRWNSTSKQRESHFTTEIEMLSKFHHSHIVSLVGYCYNSSEMILIYEYMSNGSLADHLYKINDDGSTGCALSWVQRLKICLGAARGLDYLHTGTCTDVQDGIIHRDVKSSNILLDKHWVARVSDFGLSKTNPINHSCVHTKVGGTIGYMDPEYALTQRLRMNSDIYSFGVVLFEVLCGRRVRDYTLDDEQWDLAEWVSRRVEEGTLHQLIDRNLKWEILPNSLNKFVEIACQCLCYYSKKRPTMTQVVASLELALALQLMHDSSILAMEIFENKDNVDSSIVQQEAIKICNYVKPTKRNTLGMKLANVKRVFQQFDANQDSGVNKEEKVTIINKICDANQDSCINKKVENICNDIFDTNRDCTLNKKMLMSISNKFAKAEIIFRNFDTNRDNFLSAEEIRVLVIALYLKVEFTNEQLNSLVNEFFQTCSSYTDEDKGFLGIFQMYNVEKGLTFSGFCQMYDDNVRDIDRDFATLWL
ncbi:hypothetical protein LguiA_030820 [Lonicera macranthoides]